MLRFYLPLLLLQLLHSRVRPCSVSLQSCKSRFPSCKPESRPDVSRKFCSDRGTPVWFCAHCVGCVPIMIQLNLRTLARKAGERSLRGYRDAGRPVKQVACFQLSGWLWVHTPILLFFWGSVRNPVRRPFHMSQMRWFLMNHRSLQMVTTSVEGTLLGRSSAMRCRRIDVTCVLSFTTYCFWIRDRVSNGCLNRNRPPHKKYTT